MERVDIAFRSVRVEALRSAATPSVAKMSRTVYARSVAGKIGARDVPSYVDEPGVYQSRNTETHVSLTVDVHNLRWAGVPFTLVLRIGLMDPYGRLSTTLIGPDRRAEVQQMELRSARPRQSAYTHLVAQMLRNDLMPFSKRQSIGSRVGP